LETEIEELSVAFGVL
jgi:predicted  nucleic acid-binding Zn-ribbon protein